MKNEKLDLTKPIQTECGFPFRLYSDDGAGSFPLHGTFKNENGWHLGSWTRNGKYLLDPGYSGDLNLINVP